MLLLLNAVAVVLCCAVHTDSVASETSKTRKRAQPHEHSVVARVFDDDVLFLAAPIDEWPVGMLAVQCSHDFMSVVVFICVHFVFGMQAKIQKENGLNCGARQRRHSKHSKSVAIEHTGYKTITHIVVQYNLNLSCWPFDNIMT